MKPSQVTLGEYYIYLYIYIFMTQSNVYNISSSLVWNHNHVYMICFLYSSVYIAFSLLSLIPTLLSYILLNCCISRSFSEALILSSPLTHLYNNLWSLISAVYSAQGSPLTLYVDKRKEKQSSVQNSVQCPISHSLSRATVVCNLVYSNIKLQGIQYCGL